jgi:hypothetical protein
MTCFWDSIYSHLSLEDYKFIGVGKPSNVTHLINLLKSKNKRINNVTWQKSYLSSNEKNEHSTAIQVYNIDGIKNGHLTSVCDSFLLLICELFCISISHNFMNTSIQYENLKKSRKILRFTSNSGHFQAVGTTIKSNTQSRLDRIKSNAINNSKPQKVLNNKEKRPSWRADPKGFNEWRSRIRNMNIK